MKPNRASIKRINESGSYTVSSAGDYYPADHIRLEIQLTHPDAEFPYRSLDTDVGYDIASIESVILQPGTMTMVNTGLRIAAPPGFYWTIEGRSNLAIIGIVPSRAIIDATYCGDVTVNLINYTKEPYQVKMGHRIAQFILHKQHHAYFVEVANFSPEYNQRGTRGFGSTGR